MNSLRQVLWLRVWSWKLTMARLLILLSTSEIPRPLTDLFSGEENLSSTKAICHIMGLTGPPCRRALRAPQAHLTHDLLWFRLIAMSVPPCPDREKSSGRREAERSCPQIGNKDENGRNRTENSSTVFYFYIWIRKRKRKRLSRTRKWTRTYGISKTNQIERNYVEHGQYTKKSIRNTDP